MGENNKQAKYALLYQQVSALIEGETDLNLMFIPIETEQ